MYYYLLLRSACVSYGNRRLLTSKRNHRFRSDNMSNEALPVIITLRRWGKGGNFFPLFFGDSARGDQRQQKSASASPFTPAVDLGPA